MSDPVLHVLAGPNGSGKSTLYERVIGPATHLQFINADQRRSFVTETVFSHPSKVELISAARDAGYLITLHVVMVPPDLALARVAERVMRGGRDVPERKVLDRWQRLWAYVAAAAPTADEVFFYDNSTARNPYRVVAHLRAGRPVTAPDWPDWTPDELRSLTSRT